MGRNSPNKEVLSCFTGRDVVANIHFCRKSELQLSTTDIVKAPNGDPVESSKVALLVKLAIWVVY